MKVVTIDEFQRFHQDLEKYNEEGLRKLVRGEIALNEFLDGSLKLERLAKDYCVIVTKDYNEYKKRFLEIFPGKIEPRIDNEYQHSKIAIKHGLVPIYCLMIACDSPIDVSERGIILKQKVKGKVELFYQVFIIDGSSIGARNWDKKRFFEYLKETTDAIKNHTPTDRIIRELLE